MIACFLMPVLVCGPGFIARSTTMTTASTSSELEHLQMQLVELQTQVAFQEDAITELNAALAAQQQDLATLKRQWDLLRQQTTEIQQQLPGSDVADDRPPHY
jgi:SlyX protein